MNIRKVWPHVLIILSFALIPVFSSPDFNGSLDLFKVRPFQRDLLRHLLFPIFFYLHHYFLYDRYRNNNRNYIYLLSVITSYILICWIPVLAFPVNKSFIHQGPMSPEQTLDFRFWLGPLFPFIVVWMGSTFIHIQQKTKDYELAKTKAELDSLKYQLNPHFLFNTLTAIYSLVLNRSEKAPESVLKLSSLLRYVYSESSRTYVPLNEELEYIENYIEIMRMKTSEQLKIRYDVKGERDSFEIAPMLLVSFVENAFKYGYDPDEEGSVLLDISISENGVLNFRIQNDILVSQSEQDESSGIGLENTRSRLRYLYPGKHELQIEDNKSTYKVDLIIWLKP